MKIIVEGHKIDMKDIWDIELITNTKFAMIIIKIVDKDKIVLVRHIPYETRHGEFQQYWEPYEKLYKSIKEKWEADKSEIEVFKL